MIPPRRHLPPLAALQSLEALDRLGSASAVAEELALSQSAISRQLQTLETQLGLRLIDRARKRLALNEAGKRFVAEIRPALDTIAQAALRLQVPQSGGALNLAILPAFGMRWLMPRLPDFARRHPDVTINLSTRLEPFNFAGENFDAAIWFGQGAWPGTGCLRLKPEFTLPVCSPDLATGLDPDRPETLARRPLLHIRSRPGAWAEWFARRGAALAQPPGGTLHDQFSTILQAALHGLGVALMPDYLVEQDLATGRLVAPFGAATETGGGYYLVWPETRAGDPALAAFRDWIAPLAEAEDPLPR